MAAPNFSVNPPDLSCSFLTGQVKPLAAQLRHHLGIQSRIRPTDMPPRAAFRAAARTRRNAAAAPGCLERHIPSSARPDALRAKSVAAETTGMRKQPMTGGLGGS